MTDLTSSGTPGDQPYPTSAATSAAFASHVNAGKVAAFQALGLDLVMGERSGPRFRDAFDGRWLYNCHCNGGVFNLGHRHPGVIAAVRDALDHLDIGNHHLVSGWRAMLAERLALSTGGLLPGVVFGVAGGEAIDLAIKLARAHTGRNGVVSAVGGYHGHTGLAMAAGDPEYREPFGPNLPGFVQVPFDDLAALERAVGDTTAAVILESIPATLGMPIPSAGYLASVEQLCRDRGACFVLDEVQTGLGRTGTMWYFRQEGLEPDLVVTGKGLSGGVYPITATLMTAEIHAFFEAHPFTHISTFGGSELGCVAALAVLDIIESPGFLDRVVELGERFEAGLAGLDLELRRRGMFMGLKLAHDGDALIAARDLIATGVFAVFANNDTSVLQLLPPLIITDDEADEIIAIVRAALG
jgi:putrescine aminotransferase